MMVYPYSVLFLMDKDSAFFGSDWLPSKKPHRIHVCVYLFFLQYDRQAALDFTYRVAETLLTQ